MKKTDKVDKPADKEFVFYFLMVFFVIAFLVAFLFVGVSPLKDIISTSTGLIAAVMVWLQLKRTERLNESAYIKDFNNQFITNKDMTKVEHALELYYNQMISGVENPILQLNLNRESDDCQCLINYLVYLESLASVIQQGVMHIESIHNLFAYRFFIAVNNPVVQMFEIYPYAEYYQGIFFLSDYWASICEKKDTKFSMTIPMKQFMLKKGKKPGESVNVRQAKKQDSLLIADILYQTDSYIYPAAFGKNKLEASKAIAKLVEQEDGIFSYNNFSVVTKNLRIVGMAFVLFEQCESNKESCIEIMGDALYDREMFSIVFDEYFSKLKHEEDSALVVAFAIDEEERRCHNGYHLMSYISSIYLGEKMELDVLKDNSAAVNLYKKYGFNVREEKDGFSLTEDSKPRVYHMERPALINNRK